MTLPSYEEVVGLTASQWLEKYPCNRYHEYYEIINNFHRIDFIHRLYIMLDPELDLELHRTRKYRYHGLANLIDIIDYNPEGWHDNPTYVYRFTVKGIQFTIGIDGGGASTWHFHIKSDYDIDINNKYLFDDTATELKQFPEYCHSNLLKYFRGNFKDNKKDFSSYCSGDKYNSNELFAIFHLIRLLLDKRAAQEKFAERCEKAGDPPTTCLVGNPLSE